MEYVTMKVPEDLHKRLRIEAILKNMKLQDFTEDILRRALDGGNSKTLIDSKTPYEASS